MHICDIEEFEHTYANGSLHKTRAVTEQHAQLFQCSTVLYKL